MHDSKACAPMLWPMLRVATELIFLKNAVLSGNRLNPTKQPIKTKDKK